MVSIKNFFRRFIEQQIVRIVRTGTKSFILYYAILNLNCGQKSRELRHELSLFEHDFRLIFRKILLVTFLFYFESSQKKFDYIEIQSSCVEICNITESLYFDKSNRSYQNFRKSIKHILTCYEIAVSKTD